MGILQYGNDDTPNVDVLHRPICFLENPEGIWEEVIKEQKLAPPEANTQLALFVEGLGNGKMNSEPHFYWACKAFSSLLPTLSDSNSKICVYFRIAKRGVCVYFWGQNDVLLADMGKKE